MGSQISTRRAEPQGLGIAEVVIDAALSREVKR